MGDKKSLNGSNTFPFGNEPSTTNNNTRNINTTGTENNTHNVPYDPEGFKYINKNNNPFDDSNNRPIISTNNISNNNNTFMNGNIPEMIDPGITIPIYEEDIESLDVQQPQKLGSYRARAGKFSNTLSNLLPSISAKLHHSKKNNKNNVNNNNSNNNGHNDPSMDDTQNLLSSNPNSSASSSVLINNSNNTSSNNTTDPTPVKKKHSLDNIRKYHLTPPEEPIHFPDSTNHILEVPRTSIDSYNSYTFSSNAVPPKISRTRNNTISSQLTSMSSIAQPTNQTIWSNSINITENQPSQQQHALQQLHNTNTNNTTASNNKMNSNIEVASTTNNNNPNVVNNLNAPNVNSLWVNTTRQRSLSNASSIYTDAPLYEQSGRPRASSFLAYNNNNQTNSTYGFETVNATTDTNGTNGNVPYICDDVDPRSINWVSTDQTVPTINQISNLLPTSTISISNVYPLQQQQPHLNNAINLTSTSLATLCARFGEVVSARTFKAINIALVEFDSVDSAVRALSVLQGKEVSMIGKPSTVCFAKILPMHSHQLSSTQNFMKLNQDNIGAPQSLLQEQLYSGAVTFQQQGNVSIPVFNQYYQQQTQQTSQTYQGNNQNHNHAYASHTTVDKEVCPFPLPPPTLIKKKDDLEKIIKSFDTAVDDVLITSFLNQAYECKGTPETTDFGPLPEIISNKEFDAPKLREIRKSIDNNNLTDLELEQLALCMLDELPELSSDYLGNTIVQKLFESSSDIVKDIMLRKTSKYLTSMGVHKNGTWACQKIITVATTPRQIMLVTEGIKQYCVPLFSDQFGNYVIQCVLKFGFPWNNFIFENIAANFWSIVQNRYGARAVRACLEAHDTVTSLQTLVLSSMIVLYAKYLATNSNSTLLLTWYLDTCVLPKKHSILVPELVPHIVELSRHRLASLTILKILNFRGDDHARKTTLKSIFDDYKTDEPPKSLKSILSDSNNGPTFIYKVLSMPLLEDDIRSHMVKQVRKALIDIPSAQQHRRLMEEIGLPLSNSGVSNGQIKHKKSLSHVLNSDNAGHIRGVSMSSVRSNNSRQNVIVPNGQGYNGNPSKTSGSTNMGYYNYPGMFPSGNYAGSSINQEPTNGRNSISTTDDLASQLDMFHLSNGTHVSLPQLSVTNQYNSTNVINNPNNPKPGNSNSAYGY